MAIDKYLHCIETRKYCQSYQSIIFSLIGSLLFLILACVMLGASSKAKGYPNSSVAMIFFCFLLCALLAGLVGYKMITFKNY